MRKPIPPRETPGGPEAAPVTCGKFPVLAILELANRDVRSQPRHLSCAAGTVEALRRHLKEDDCALCLRWYRNARRAYRDTLRDLARPVRRVPLLAEAREAPAAGTGSFWIPTRPEPVGQPLQGLDALDLVLNCPAHGDGASEVGRCWVRLLFQFPVAAPDPGRREPDLRRFDGQPILLKYWTPGQERPHRRHSRLDLNPEGALVSPPECLLLDDPRKLVQLSVRPEFDLERLLSA